MLHVIGDDALEVYGSFTFEESKQNKITPLIATFVAYCTPKKNLKYVYLYIWNGRPFDTFVVDLPNKANTCEFGALRAGASRTHFDGGGGGGGGAH